MVQWPSPVLARSSRFRPMSPASQVGLEAYKFESCRERFFFFTNLIKYLHFVRRTLSTHYPGFQRIFFLIDNEAALKQKKRRGEKNLFLSYFFLLGALRLVNAASPRTISVHKKKISSGTQGRFTLSLLQNVQVVNFCTLNKLSFKIFL